MATKDDFNRVKHGKSLLLMTVIMKQLLISRSIYRGLLISMKRTITSKHKKP